MRSEMAQAVCALRHELHETQQEFSNRMGVAMGTIARYEIDNREPTFEIMYLLAQQAIASGRNDLAEVFRGALGARVTARMNGTQQKAKGEHAQTV